jgi:hypothetical protein
LKGGLEWACKTKKIGKAPTKTLNAQVGFNVGHSL